MKVSETKLDESFPIDQFIIEDLGVNRNANGQGIMLFARQDIPSKLVSAENSPTYIDRQRDIDIYRYIFIFIFIYYTYLYIYIFIHIEDIYNIVYFICYILS